MQAFLLDMISSLNVDRRVAFDAVIAAIYNSNHDDQASRLFFVDGPGGTGKSFLYNILLTYVRCQRHLAVAVASFGIAALLLKGGKTAYSRFKIPVEGLNSTLRCRMPIQSYEAQLLKAAKLITWDEVSMASRYAIEAVDRLLCDIMGTVDENLESVPFGGKVVLFGGNFRQTPPAISMETRAQSSGHL